MRSKWHLIALIVGLTVACVTGNEVTEELEAARACADGDSCDYIGLPCVLGCWALLNAADVEEMKALVDRYERQHRGKVRRYECKCGSPPAAVVCEDGFCVRGERED